MIYKEKKIARVPNFPTQVLGIGKHPKRYKGRRCRRQHQTKFIYPKFIFQIYIHIHTFPPRERGKKALCTFVTILGNEIEIIYK